MKWNLYSPIHLVLIPFIFLHFELWINIAFKSILLDLFIILSLIGFIQYLIYDGFLPLMAIYYIYSLP